jgi:hypothetical protein
MVAIIARFVLVVDAKVVTVVDVVVMRGLDSRYIVNCHEGFNYKNSFDVVVEVHSKCDFVG